MWEELMKNLPHQSSSYDICIGICTNIKISLILKLTSVKSFKWPNNKILQYVKIWQCDNKPKQQACNRRESWIPKRKVQIRTFGNSLLRNLGQTVTQKQASWVPATFSESREKSKNNNRLPANPMMGIILHATMMTLFWLLELVLYNPIVVRKDKMQGLSHTYTNE